MRFHQAVHSTRSDRGPSSEGCDLRASALTSGHRPEPTQRPEATQSHAPRHAVLQLPGLAAGAALTRPLPCPLPGLQGEDWQLSEGVFSQDLQCGCMSRPRVVQGPQCQRLCLRCAGQGISQRQQGCSHGSSHQERPRLAFVYIGAKSVSNRDTNPLDIY